MLVYAAYKLMPNKTDTNIKKTGSIKRLFIISAAASFTFFLLFHAGPYDISNPIIIMLLGVVFILCASRYADRFQWILPESTMNRLSVASGGLTLMIFLAFLQEFRGMKGMSGVSLSAFALLLLLKRKIKRERQ